MKNRTLKLTLMAGAILVSVATIFTGCTTPMHQQTTPDASYQQALKRTDPLSAKRLASGSDMEREAIERVKAMYSHYDEKSLQTSVRNVYAGDVYFRDAFKLLTTPAEIEHYMLDGVKKLRSCTFEFQDVIAKDGDYYFRWIMSVNLMRDKPDKISRSMGISHMRFNEQGQVVFHQDYWDPTDVVYSRIPVANWLIRKVKEMQ